MKFNENWYDNRQIKELEELLSKVKDIEGDIIEIGVWEGKSTFTISNQLFPQPVIAVDSWLGNVYEDTQTSKLGFKTHPTLEILNKRDVYSVWKDNIEDYKTNHDGVSNILEYRGDCFKFIELYKSGKLPFEVFGKIKFVHIDADHHYDSVKKTIDELIPLMIPGGVMCGDDYGKNESTPQTFLKGGVKKAVQDSFNSFGTGYHDLWYKIFE